MNVRNLFATAALVWLFGAGNALAQDPDDGDSSEATIRLMGNAEAELPDAVTKEISLPEHLAENANALDNSAKGLSTANENKLRREQGLATADAARERGAEMSEAAQENRENRGRSTDRPERPEVPQPPENPGEK